MNGSDPFGLSEAIRGLLADGEWHPRADLMKLLPLIPPEAASHKFQSLVRLNKAKAEEPLNSRISRGRVLALTRRLRDMVHRGVLEMKENFLGDDRGYRLARPQETAGVTVFDAAVELNQLLRKVLQSGSRVSLILSLDHCGRVVLNELEVSGAETRGKRRKRRSAEEGDGQRGEAPCAVDSREGGAVRRMGPKDW